MFPRPRLRLRYQARVPPDGPEAFKPRERIHSEQVIIQTNPNDVLTVAAIRQARIAGAGAAKAAAPAPIVFKKLLRFIMPEV